MLAAIKAAQTCVLVSGSHKQGSAFVFLRNCCSNMRILWSYLSWFLQMHCLQLFKLTLLLCCRVKSSNTFVPDFTDAVDIVNEFQTSPLCFSLTGSEVASAVSDVLTVIAIAWLQRSLSQITPNLKRKKHWCSAYRKTAHCREKMLCLRTIATLLKRRCEQFEHSSYASVSLFNKVDYILTSLALVLKMYRVPSCLCIPNRNRLPKIYNSWSVWRRCSSHLLFNVTSAPMSSVGT